MRAVVVVMDIIDDVAVFLIILVSLALAAGIQWAGLRLFLHWMSLHRDSL
jgi:hypothetical protein